MKFISYKRLMLGGTLFLIISSCSLFVNSFATECEEGGNIPRCDGNILVTCNGDLEVREDCGANVCNAEGAGSCDLCGNGAVDAGETCDDGNIISGDGCDEFCQLEAFCGDGNLDDGEVCDDNNVLDGDGCDSNCTITACENAVPSPGEFCFAQQVLVPVGVQPEDIAIGDIDNDNDEDIVFIGTEADGQVIQLVRNNGVGGFGVPEAVHQTDQPLLSLILGDLNGDSFIDIAVSQRGIEGVGGNNAIIDVFINNGTGTFGTPISFDTGEFLPEKLLSSDIDDDSDIDLLLLTGGGIILSRNNGGASFASALTGGFSERTLAIGDADGDQDIDIFGSADSSGYGTTNSVSSLLNIGNAEFSGFIRSSEFLEAIGFIITADINGDGNDDIIATSAFQATDELRIFFSDGISQFIEQTPITIGGRPRSIVVDDFNNDSFIDFATVNLDASDISINLGNGSGLFTDFLFSVGAQDANSLDNIATADINSDGVPDLIVSNFSSSDISLILSIP